MNQISYETIYKGKNVKQWHIKDYIVSYNFGRWMCSCAIKYKRDPSIKCKHIDIVKAFLDK